MPSDTMHTNGDAAMSTQEQMRGRGRRSARAAVGRTGAGRVEEQQSEGWLLLVVRGDSRLMRAELLLGPLWPSHVFSASRHMHEPDPVRPWPVRYG